MGAAARGAGTMEAAVAAAAAVVHLAVVIASAAVVAVPHRSTRPPLRIWSHFVKLS